MMKDTPAPSCGIGRRPDYDAIAALSFSPSPPLADYLKAMQFANEQAQAQLGDNMLLSWYDRDRDFESPQHASECHAGSAVPGYVVYAYYHGANLKIDIEQGRFVFFYLGLDLD
jgi:hypothetical protein